MVGKLKNAFIIASALILTGMGAANAQPKSGRTEFAKRLPIAEKQMKAEKKTQKVVFDADKLFGQEIMDAEHEGGVYRGREVEAAKKLRAETLEEVVKKLIKKGFNKPIKNEREFRALYNEIKKIHFDNFEQIHGSREATYFVIDCYAKECKMNLVGPKGKTLYFINSEAKAADLADILGIYGIDSTFTLGVVREPDKEVGTLISWENFTLPAAPEAILGVKIGKRTTYVSDEGITTLEKIKHKYYIFETGGEEEILLRAKCTAIFFNKGELSYRIKNMDEIVRLNPESYYAHYVRAQLCREHFENGKKMGERILAFCKSTEDCKKMIAMCPEEYYGDYILERLNEIWSIYVNKRLNREADFGKQPKNKEQEARITNSMTKCDSNTAYSGFAISYGKEFKNESLEFSIMIANSKGKIVFETKEIKMGAKKGEESAYSIQNKITEALPPGKYHYIITLFDRIGDPAVGTFEVK